MMDPPSSKRRKVNPREEVSHLPLAVTGEVAASEVIGEDAAVTCEAIMHLPFGILGEEAAGEVINEDATATSELITRSPLETLGEDAAATCFEYLYIDEQCQLKGVSRQWRTLAGASLARERSPAVLRESRGSYATTLLHVSRACPRILNIVCEHLDSPLGTFGHLGGLGTFEHVGDPFGAFQRPEKKVLKMVRTPLKAQCTDRDVAVAGDMRLQDVARAACAPDLTSLVVKSEFACRFGNGFLGLGGNGERRLCLNPRVAFPSLKSLRLDVSSRRASYGDIEATLRELSSVWQYIDRIDELRLSLQVHHFDSALALHFEKVANLRGLHLRFLEGGANEETLSAWTNGIGVLGRVLPSEIEHIYIRGGGDGRTPRTVSDAYDAFTSTVARRCPHLEGGVLDELLGVESWLTVKFDVARDGARRRITYTRDVGFESAW